jgi:hypothetical protein
MSVLARTRRIAPLVLLLVGAAPVGAQSIRFTSGPADCNLARKAFDNPFSDSRGFTLRRYEWHAFYAALSIGTAEALHRATGWPRWSTALISSVGIGVVPHLRQLAMAANGARTIDAKDWVFDAYVRSAPLFVWRPGASGGNPRSKTRAAAAFVDGYLSLACFASP